MTDAAPFHGIRPELKALAVDVTRLVQYPGNPNNGDVDALAESLATSGQYRPVVVWQRGEDRPGVILAGNTTYAAALSLGWTHLACTPVVADTELEARRIMLADNSIARLARPDIAAEIALLQTFDGYLLGTGYTDESLGYLIASLETPVPPDPGGDAPAANPTLADRFGVPPFSVLDARSGPWTARKAAWKALGIASELGRSDTNYANSGATAVTRLDFGGYAAGAGGARKPKRGGAVQSNLDGADAARYGRPRTLAQGLTAARDPATGELTYTEMPGTAAVSIFDPVLCELVYRWFSATGHLVLDPWAGGSVRGIVAARLGRRYTGIELRPEQTAANRAQLPLAGDGPPPTWIDGESTEELRALDTDTADLIFGCPPYYDLERYSDDPRDLSTMSHTDFDLAMAANIAEAARVLRPDSFACFVVGNVRHPSGRLVDMAAMIVRVCADAGLVFYNDAVLITQAGSLPIRAGRTFAATRVLGRTHQQVLIFVKGDRRRAADRCGTVDVETALVDYLQAQAPAGSADARQSSAPVELTPIETHGGYQVKRDDTLSVGGQRGGKVRTCLVLGQRAAEDGSGGLTTAGSRHSPQVAIVAAVGAALGLPVRAHVPAGPQTRELTEAERLGAVLIRHPAGRNSVIIARARADAAARQWTDIPFGMECDEAVRQTAGQAASIAALDPPPDRIVIPVGSGMSAAGLLAGLAAHGLSTPVLGVTVGADPTRRLDRYAPDWREQLTLTASPLSYDQRPQHTRLGELELDPVYEAKCLPYLRPGDLLWVVGHRGEG